MLYNSWFFCFLYKRRDGGCNVVVAGKGEFSSPLKAANARIDYYSCIRGIVTCGSCFRRNVITSFKTSYCFVSVGDFRENFIQRGSLSRKHILIQFYHCLVGN